MGVVGIDVGVEGPGVEDQRDGAISEPRISSIRSETSLWPLRPLAAALRCRRSPAPRCCSSAVRVTSAIVTPRRSASWRSRASRSSGSFTVVRRIGMPAYHWAQVRSGAAEFEPATPGVRSAREVKRERRENMAISSVFVVTRVAHAFRRIRRDMRRYAGFRALLAGSARNQEGRLEWSRASTVFGARRTYRTERGGRAKPSPKIKRAR